MKKRHLLALFLIILLPNYIFSQIKISGEIKDDKNNPIEFVEIQLQNKDSIIFKSELTNTEGKFIIETEKGEYSLLIRLLGVIYHKQKVNTTQDTYIGIINITEKTQELTEVIVSAKRPIYKQDFDKLIFNVENSPLKSGFDGLEVLKRTPKLQVNSNGDILLRKSSVLVLINGRKSNLSGQELSNYLSSLNSENIKNIEIQTVGNSTTDASNSGGVININLKKQPKGFQSTLKNFYIHRDKNNGVYYSGITTQFGSEKWNIYNKIDNRDNSNKSDYNSVTNFYISNGKNVNNGYYMNKNKNFSTITGLVFYPNNKNEFGIEFYLNNNNSKRNGIETLNTFNPHLYSISINDENNLTNTNTWYSTMNYTYKIDSLGSNIKIISDFGNNNLNNKNEVDTRYSFGSILNNANQFVTDAKSLFYSFQADLNKKYNNWELNTGVKLLNVERESDFNKSILQNNNWTPAINGQEIFKNNEIIIANYFSIAKKWNEKHNFKIGLRTEYTNLKGEDLIQNSKVNQNYFDWFPNLYYSYSIQENKSISFSYSRRIQRPSFRDLNPFVNKQNDFLYQIGNPNLKPQYTNKIDVTYQLKNQSFSFYSNFTNDIIAGVYRTENNISYYQPQNFGKEREIGFDYSYYGDITKWLYVNTSLGIWNYQFQLGELNPNRFAFSNTINLNVKFTKSFFLDVYNNLFSKNQFQVSEGAEQYKLDIALQKNIWNGNGIIRIVAEDIFNTQRDKNLSSYKDFNFQFYQKPITQSFTIMFIYTFKGKGDFQNRNIKNDNNNKNRL